MEPRGPQRAGWRPDGLERLWRRRRGDKIAAPREGSAGTAGEAREELPRGPEPLGSTSGRRRWACRERTWLAVPRRSLAVYAVERGGEPTAGVRAEPPLPLRAWDLRWGFREAGGWGRGRVRNRDEESLGLRGQDSEAQKRSL